MEGISFGGERRVDVGTSRTIRVTDKRGESRRGSDLVAKEGLDVGRSSFSGRGERSRAVATARRRRLGGIRI